MVFKRIGVFVCRFCVYLSAYTYYQFSSKQFLRKYCYNVIVEYKLWVYILGWNPSSVIWLYCLFFEPNMVVLCGYSSSLFSSLPSIAHGLIWYRRLNISLLNCMQSMSSAHWGTFMAPICVTSTSHYFFVQQSPHL